MKLTRVLGIILFLLLYQFSVAQLIWLKPENPSVNDSVTLYFNAAEGNKALMDHTGDVYLHTGVITNRSLDGHDWKYVVGTWGKDDKNVLMKREGKNLYSYRFVIKPFYKLGPDDIANQLAYVFRNMDGTIVGKTRENEDITVPVNGYKPIVQEASGGNRELHKLIRVEQLPASWNCITDKGTIAVHPFAEGIVEVTFLPGNSSKADPSHSVIMQPGKVSLISEQTPSGYILRNGNMTITAHADPFYLTYIYKGDTLLSEESGFFSNPGNSGVRFALKPGEITRDAGSASTTPSSWYSATTRVRATGRSQPQRRP